MPTDRKIKKSMAPRRAYKKRAKIEVVKQSRIELFLIKLIKILRVIEPKISKFFTYIKMHSLIKKMNGKIEDLQDDHEE